MKKLMILWILSAYVLFAAVLKIGDTFTLNGVIYTVEELCNSVDCGFSPGGTIVSYVCHYTDSSSGNDIVRHKVVLVSDVH